MKVLSENYLVLFPSDENSIFRKQYFYFLENLQPSSKLLALKLVEIIVIFLENHQECFQREKTKIM